ncbi:Transcription factor 25 [Merluccius polli]|uniref:Transcription factor 25 n=1 Tax=Merluccius polli TaxID=89951 RepID=A0AA47P2Q8_MERPO|nr:Transcription factor 25 [Merluccius polli]
MTTVYPSSDGYFQQDNAPCHKARIISDWFLEHDNEFTVLKWPPQSPDLNPIEHLWDVVEREIRIMDVQPTNLQQLRDAIMSIWTKLSEECFQYLVESVPRRIKAVLKAKGGPTRPRQRQRQFHRTTWMTIPKDTWPRFSRPGISMSLLQSKDGLHYFTFEHSRDYQQVQFKFMDAVDSMNNNNILTLLLTNPYHIDSLLQLSDVCRIHEDPEMARELIERALYSFECSFHPLFSLTSGTCRLDFLRPENRAFYLALYKHMMFLENRGCPRTALEYCKLILSLDPESDPFCMLLLIDFLALRSREYHSILRLYQDWEEHKNLSQLPNFAFSVALCHFHLSEEDDTKPEEREKYRKNADHLLQHALIMFPGLLTPLLDLCTVQPDATVSSHAFFGPKSQIGQSPALAELTHLYVGRNHLLWREGGVLLWLEECVKEVLLRVDAKDPLVEDGQNKRKQRYQSAPRAIHRHVLLSEIKEATSFLPLDVTTQPGMGFDPLPPLDSVTSYTRPERPQVGATDESTLSLFFRSLLPNFNLQVSGGVGERRCREGGCGV